MAFFHTRAAQPNIGSQIGQALGQGLQTGVLSQFEQAMQRQQQQALMQQKQAMLDQYLQSPEGKQQSPMTQQMLKLHAQGLIPDAALSKALEPEIFKQKMAALGIDVSKIMGGQQTDQQTEQQPLGDQQPQQGIQKPKEQKYAKEQLEKLTLIPETKAFAEQKLQEMRDIGKEERRLGRAGMESFFEKVESDRLRIPQERMASEMIVDAIKSGEIDPFSSAHIGAMARSLGAPEAITKILETPGSKEFNTARKTFIGNTIQDAFRGTTSRTEINLAEDMLSELGVSKRGNLASIWGVQSAIDIREQRIELADQLKERGVPATQIPAMVDKMLKPYIQQVKKEYFDALKSLRGKK